MRGTKRITAAVLCSLFVIPAAPGSVDYAQAQDEHVAGKAELNRAIGERLRDEDADRDAVKRLLRRPEVRRVADRLGLDLRPAEAAVSTLSGPELERISSEARSIESDLVGGDAPFSTNTMIILLLVIIVLLLVA